MLAVDGLRFSYSKGGEELFNGLSHAFTPGSTTALTGPSGRGKSTLLYVLGLLLSPSAGTVTIDGLTASRLSDCRRSEIRANKVGFVFQDSELDPSRTVLDSVIEPCLYAGQRRREVVAQAKELLDDFGLGHRADHRPGQISGGQAQRVAACRALVNSPSIVLADEPTGNLDRDNARLVLEHLTGAARTRGVTLVIATHDPFVLEHVDEVVEL